MNSRIKKASFTFLAILFSIPVFFIAFITTTMMINAIANRVVHEPPTMMVSHEGTTMETVLWRLGSKKSALEFVRVDEWSDYGTRASATTTYLGPRISFVSDVGVDIKVKDLWERQRSDWSDDFEKEVSAILPTCKEDVGGRRVAGCVGVSGQKPTCSCAKTI